MRPKRSKVRIALIVIDAVLAVVLLVVLAGVVYLSGKMNLLTRPSLETQADAESTSGTDPADEMLSFGTFNFDDIDVMENGGTIKPPEGEVNVHENITNILVIGSDERTEDDDARADSMMLISIDSRKNTWKMVSFERGVGVSIPLSLIHI